MRYGGSYAPYHGFLYGTPKVFAPTQVHGGFGYPPYAPYGYGFPAESAPVDPPHHESPTASGAE